MATTFTLGIDQLSNELTAMQSPGLYWICFERQQDASLFCRTTISSQSNNANVALICTSKLDPAIFATALKSGPARLPTFSLPETSEALKGLTEDIMRSFNPHNSLLLLNSPHTLWLTLNPRQLAKWCQRVDQWLKQNSVTLLLISYGHDGESLKINLLPLYKILAGLSFMQVRANYFDYDVSWWSNKGGVTARLTAKLSGNESGWTLRSESLEQPQSYDDDYLYYVNQSVLEGAPALSKNWRLCANNEEVVDRSRYTQAATVILSISSNAEIQQLARQIHNLRLQRGNGLKLVVRELKQCLRYNDERLLLACGTSLIVPYNAPLSRFLTLVDALQGQLFTRPVITDIEQLLNAMTPLQVKGPVPLVKFCQYLKQITTSSLQDKELQSLLVAFKTVPGLSAKQALTLCHFRRDGDFVTIANGHMYLFLSACRLNDLDIALSYIFRLPIDEIFTSRSVWQESREIAGEAIRLENNLNSSGLAETVSTSAETVSTSAETVSTSVVGKTVVEKIETEQDATASSTIKRRSVPQPSPLILCETETK